MLQFYKRAISLFLAVVMISGLLVLYGMALSKIDIPLLPNGKSAMPWVHSVEPRSATGKTSLSISNNSQEVAYDFFLSSEEEYPYTSYAFNFTDKSSAPKLVDLSQYDVVSFKILCEPRNILLFVLFTFDDKTTDLADTATYRVNSTFLTCDREWRTVVIQLDNLDTPDWWLQNSGLELIDRDYQLDKVISFALVNSLQSPRDVESEIQLKDVDLIGEDLRYFYLCVALSISIWLAFLFWFFRQYVRELVGQVRDKMKQDMPLIAYQKLSITPQKDKEKGTLLSYLASHYSNPELSAEFVASELGINRYKINEILKEELDLTFTSYINKLRLTESARLLSEHGSMNIAQIAYAVGFNNVPYFNKLFKSEYGCTPKIFKNNYKSDTV